MISTVLYFVAGLILLLGGAHLLVSSSSRLAVRFGIPSIFIGVTIVAFATSAPEIAVSLDAIMDNRAGLALGNVVGSNIANILLILGISAIIAPVRVTWRIVWLDIPIMIFTAIIVYLLALDNTLGPVDGGIMLFLFTVFLFFQVRHAKNNRSGHNNGERQGQKKPKARNAYLQGLLLLAGLAVLGLGAHLLVDSAITMARFWGMSELIIGLTIVAVGTSLPELATSVLAARRNESDLSVGNVIGSNIFNVLLVLGISAFFSGGMQISNAALALDFPFMVAVSIACLPIFFTGHIIARWEGVVFVGYYAAYLVFLFLDATQHKLLPLFNEVMFLFVGPLTALTLLIIAIRSWKKSGLKQD